MYINLIPSFLILNCKIVYRLGDAPVMSWRPFSFFWKNYITKRTLHFVNISKYIQKTLTEAGRDVSIKDSVIYNYPPIRTKKENFPKINFSKKGLTFTYLGQIVEQKGVRHFIECAINICTTNSDVYFLIAGSLEYSKEFAKSLLNMVSMSTYTNRILFLGNVENIDDLFDKTDVLVVPSIKQEPLGNVIVEAKSRSKPCIIYNTGGMPELIEHKIDGFICSNATSESLQIGIDYYIDNRQLISDHGLNSFNSIKKLGIDYESYTKNWINIFK